MIGHSISRQMKISVTVRSSENLVGTYSYSSSFHVMDAKWLNAEKWYLAAMRILDGVARL